MMMEDVADFEEMAKKSWQSFSTMKRFVSEASRLENASWRLWFMQRSAMRQPEHHAHEASEHEYVPCVYCEMHAASLSCHGCCHDAYCVSCFKLVHKKGHLATHTAVKIQELTARERERLAAHVRGDVEMASDEESEPKAPPESTLPTVVAVSPEQSRHPPTRDRATRKAKSWEVQMDMLLQRLMLNSIHSDNDISVHNIDSRHSLGTAESLASMLSDTTSSEDPTAALQSLLHDGSDDGIEVEGGRVPAPDCEWKERGSGGSHSNTDAVTAKAMEREQPHADGKTEERATRKLFSVDVSAQDTEELPSSPTATMTPSSSASSMGVVSPAIGPLNASDESLESLDGLSMSLFSTPTMAKSKSRKKNSVCANCSGNHITIDCPLLENSLGGNVGLPSASGGLHTGGVDTVLRKCFTTIHNDNLSNSTHAFLGDEISVRGGGNFSKAQFGSTTKTSALWSTFGMNSIAEDQAADVEDSLPVLVGLVADGEPRRWDCGTWMVSCLATELPLDVFQTLRRADKMASSDPLGENGLPSTFGWVHVKKPGSKWCKRFMCLHRNSLWEYLDDKETSRPIAYANLADGTVHAHQNTTVEFAFRFFRYSTPDSPRDECWMQCESEQDTTRWRDALTRASKLQAEDIFDMRPDSPTSSPHEDPYELGKGRFASVRRARRRKGVSSSQKVEDCALKIIDKRVFWDLVAHETERDDTVIREILTQALLTIRAGSGYCPVIRLLSLFETRSHLIMELELMREGDLHEEIVTKSAVSEARASFLVSSLVQAIKFCLENGVAHRDVKLSNLALDTSASSKGRTLSVIKLADFGMAAFVQEDGMLRGRCGTPGFVAPEILTAGKGEAYPAGVDMFSVGVVTYTMLCGYEPFFGVNDEELIQMNKAVDYEFEEPEWSSISDEAKDLITLMMERDPTRRITPAEALHHPFLIDATRALREVATGVDSQPSAPFVRLL